MSENNNTWTIAYRKRTANRFIRPTNFAGTWSQAKALAEAFAEASPEMQVYYVSTREAELARRVSDEDIANVLVDSGKRVRIVEQGEVPAELIARVPSDEVASSRWAAGERLADPVAGAPAAPVEIETPASDRLAAQAASMSFPFAGQVKGSNVWRNRETGVEIIKGKNFAEVGLYYVCVPAAPRDHDGADARRVVAHRTSFAAARRVAQGRALAWRFLIAQAFDAAVSEAEDRAAAQLAQIREWMARHELLSVPGHLLADATIAAVEADRYEALGVQASRARLRRSLASVGRGAAPLPADELDESEATLLATYEGGPRIWDAAGVYRTVLRLDARGLITPANSKGAYTLTAAGREMLARTS